MAGVNWAVREAVNLYGNISSSFDPPATTELANPDGPTGFNQNLDSQTATNYEIGVKGLLTGRLRYELALFHIDVNNAIVPFELEGSGQSFFQNAGKSTHDGLEAAVSMELAPGLTGTATYTWSDFTYDEFTGLGDAVYDGNRIPGVPEQLFNLDLAWVHPSCSSMMVLTSSRPRAASAPPCTTSRACKSCHCEETSVTKGRSPSGSPTSKNT